MNKIALLIILISCLCSTIRSQDQPPQLLVRAAHCLADKHLLSHSKFNALTFGYLVDGSSYPGKKVLYVVNYPARSLLSGSIFTMFVTQRDNYQVFNIQNNASFVLSKSDRELSFVNQPLGGTWTQQNLTSAIKQIEKQAIFTISAKDMLAVEGPVSCESYTDPHNP